VPHTFILGVETSDENDPVPVYWVTPPQSSHRMFGNNSGGTVI